MQSRTQIDLRKFFGRRGYHRAPFAFGRAVRDGFIRGLFLLALTVASATEYVVPGDFDTIQAAVDSAQPGDAVRVKAGTYTESLTLKSGVRLEGDGPESTIVQISPQDGAALFAYEVTDSSVSGFTFEQSPGPDGFEPLIFPYPVVLLFNSRVQCTNSKICRGAYFGALVYGGESTFNDVEFKDNTHSGAVLRGDGTHAIFTRCAIRNNGRSGLVVRGVRAYAVTQNCVMEGNTLYGFVTDEESHVYGPGSDIARNGVICARNIAMLWTNKDFAQFEVLARRLRNEKPRFTSGDWQLTAFYGWLYEFGASAGPEREARYTALIDEWKAAFPDSIVWRIVLAQYYYDRAWSYRGGGYANSVSKEGWRGYGEYLVKAWDVVQAAATVQEQDPEYYVLRSKLAMEMEQVEPTGKDPGRAAFAKGVALEPLYYPLYYTRIRELLPRWGGTPEAVLRFAERSADDTKELAGDALYAVIAAQVATWESDEDFLAYGFSWPRIQEGYEDFLKANPESVERLNEYAWLACVHKDQEKAADVFTRLDGLWLSGVWGDADTFDAFQNWAVNGKQYPGPSPMLAAIEVGNVKSVERMLGNGIDPNGIDTVGNPVIQFAILNNQLEIVRHLLEAGADPNSKDIKGRFTIDYALSVRDGRYLDILLRQGMNPEPDTNAEWTPLMKAIDWERYDYVEPLLRAGANPNGGTKLPAGPLVFALAKGKPDLIRLLIKYGADVNVPPRGAGSVLCTAVQMQSIEISRVLLAAAADPNLAPKSGRGPLFIATDAGNLELVKMLLDAGADVHAKDFYGRSVFHAATLPDALPVAKYLLEKFPDGALSVTPDNRTLLHNTAESGNVELAQLLIECGVDVNAVETAAEKTALELAIETGHETVADLLRKNGATE